MTCTPSQGHERPESTGGQQADTHTPLRVALAGGVWAGGRVAPLFYCTLYSLSLSRAGHPANMAVVLLAMGGYGTYLGWQIRVGEDADDVAKAQDLHPKLMAGMTFFFSLGALGGMISMVMQGKPAFESSHFLTGSAGLVLLYLQVLPHALVSCHTQANSDRPMLRTLRTRSCASPCELDVFPSGDAFAVLRGRWQRAHGARVPRKRHHGTVRCAHAGGYQVRHELLSHRPVSRSVFATVTPIPLPLPARPTVP